MVEAATQGTNPHPSGETTHSHTEQFGVKYLAQGHVDMWTGEAYSSSRATATRNVSVTVLKFGKIYLDRNNRKVAAGYSHSL